MQLIDLVRGRWLAVLGIPLVAAVVAGILTYSMTDPAYVASARVAVSQVLPRDASSFQIDPVIQDFVATFTSDEVAAGVVADTHLPPLDVVGKLTAVTSDGGVTVGFTSLDQKQAQAGLEAAVRLTLLSLLDETKAQAQVEASAAKAEVDRTGQAIAALQDKTKVRDAPVEYERRLEDLLALRNQQAAADAAGQARLGPLVEQKGRELEAIGAILPTATQLDAASKAASDRLADAQGAVALASARIDAITADPTVARSLSTTPSSRTGVLAQAVVGAAVLTAAVVLLLIWRRTWTGRIPIAEEDEEDGLLDPLDDDPLDGDPLDGDPLDGDALDGHGRGDDLPGGGDDPDGTGGRRSSGAGPSVRAGRT